MTVPDAWPDLLGTAADWADVTSAQADAGPVPYCCRTFRMIVAASLPVSVCRCEMAPPGGAGRGLVFRVSRG